MARARRSDCCVVPSVPRAEGAQGGCESDGRRRADENQAEEEPDEFHPGAAERAGKAFRRDPLPGRVHAGGAEPAAGALRGQGAGTRGWGCVCSGERAAPLGRSRGDAGEEPRPPVTERRQLPRSKLHPQIRKASQGFACPGFVSPSLRSAVFYPGSAVLPSVPRLPRLIHGHSGSRHGCRDHKVS